MDPKNESKVSNSAENGALRAEKEKLRADRESLKKVRKIASTIHYAITQLEGGNPQQQSLIQAEISLRELAKGLNEHDLDSVPASDIELWADFEKGEGEAYQILSEHLLLPGQEAARKEAQKEAQRRRDLEKAAQKNAAQAQPAPASSPAPEQLNPNPAEALASPDDAAAQNNPAASSKDKLKIRRADQLQRNVPQNADVPSVDKAAEEAQFLGALRPEIKEMLESSGINLEDLKQLEHFDDIKDSEGKLFFVLENFKHIKHQRIKETAKEEFALERQQKGLLGKIATAPFKSFAQRMKEQKVAKRNGPEAFNIADYKADLDRMARVAAVGPEMSITSEKWDKNKGFKKSEGEASVVFNYLKDVPGVKPEKMTAFNFAATEYSKLPPEGEWNKFSGKIKKFKAIKEAYLEQRAEVMADVFHGIPASSNLSLEEIVKFHRKAERDAELLIEKTDAKIKLNQTLISHPEVEEELHKLSQEKGWSRFYDALISQANIGTAGMAAGVLTRALTRGVVKSSLVTLGATAALPLAMVGLGSVFGNWRGGARGKEQLAKEEEFIRIGLESNTKSGRDFEKVLKQRAKIVEIINADPDKTANSPTYKKYQKKLRALDDKILAIRQKSTDMNYVKAASDAEKETRGLSEKISDLTEKVKIKFVDYLQTPEGAGVTEPEFNELKKVWTGKLEARLEYTKRKLDEGKIVFGSTKDALKHKLDLMEVMGDASAAIALQYNGDIRTEQASKFGKTRSGQLEKILDRAEYHINENREKYIQRQKVIGRYMGGLTVIGGYQLMDLIKQGLSSDIAHAVFERARELQATVSREAGNTLIKTFMDVVKIQLGHGATQEIIESSTETLPTPSPSPVKLSASAPSSVAPAAAPVTLEAASPMDAPHPDLPPMSPEDRAALFEQEMNASVNAKPEFEPIDFDQEAENVSAVNNDIAEPTNQAVDKIFESLDGDLLAAEKTPDSNVFDDLANQGISAQSVEDAFRSQNNSELISKITSDMVSPYQAPDVAPYEITPGPREMSEKMEGIFQYELQNETQSREYALIKYFESKGMSHKEAGKEAYKTMMNLYPGKGERALPWVHKGDHVLILEHDGKIDIKVQGPREHALAQYLMNKGESYEDAVEKASETMKELYPKGEHVLSKLGKKDAITFAEHDGVLEMQVKGKAVELGDLGLQGEQPAAPEAPATAPIEQPVAPSVDQPSTTAPETNTAPASRAVDGQPPVISPVPPGTNVAEILLDPYKAEQLGLRMRENPQAFGYMGPDDPISIGRWADAQIPEIVRTNPDLASMRIGPDESFTLEKTAGGAWRVDIESAPVSAFSAETPASSVPAEEVAVEAASSASEAAMSGNPAKELLLNYDLTDVSEPTDLPHVLESIVKADPRWEKLGEEAKDKVFYDLLVNHFLKVAEGKGPEFYQNLGISSGNPLEISKDALNLADAFPENIDPIDEAFKNASEGRVDAKASGAFKNMDEVVGGILAYIESNPGVKLDQKTFDMVLEQVKATNR